MSDETVKKMVVEKIRELGGDGLVDWGERCGCILKEIASCGNIGMDCRAARKFRCSSCYRFSFLPLQDRSETMNCWWCNKPIGCSLARGYGERK